jgi:hypothetical protein
MARKNRGKRQQAIVATQKQATGNVPTTKTSVAPAGGKQRRRGRGAAQRKIAKDAGPSINGQKVKVDTLSTNNIMSTTNNQIRINVVLGPTVIADLAWGIVAYALSLGYQTFTDNDNDPFYAYVYLSTAITSALANSTPQTQKILKSLGELIDYLRPQVIQKWGSEIVYTFQPNFDPSAFPPTFALGPAGGRTANFYFPSSTIVNGLYPQMQAPAAYSASAGLQAFNSLLAYLSNQGMGEPMELIPFENHRVKPDASAFATCTGIMGGSSSGSGGFELLAMLETFIDTPTMSVFVPITFNSTSKTRSFVQARMTSGSPMWAGLLKSQNTLNSSFHTKTPIRFTCVDFYEIVETICSWMQKVAQEAANDYQNANKPLSTFVLPVTGQEMLILLRQVMVAMFGDSIIATQSMYPSSSIGDPIPFIPFVASSGTGPLGEVGKNFMLPQDLWENIQALLMRRQDHKNGSMYVPLLGVYFGFEFDTSRFVVVRGEESLPLFQVPEADKKILGSRKDGAVNVKMVKTKLGETPIDIVDGNIGAGNFVQLNSPYSYETILQKYLEWTSEIIPFTSTLGQTNKDGGIPVMAVAGDFNYIKVLGQNEKKQFEDMHCDLPERLRPRGKEKKSLMGASPFDGYLIVASCFNSKPLDVVRSISRLWVLPQVLDQGGAFTDETRTIEKSQIYYQAHFSLIGQSNLEQMTVAQKCEAMAQRNVKARNGVETVAEQLYRKVTEVGAGGILGNLTRALLEGWD